MGRMSARYTRPQRSQQPEHKDVVTAKPDNTKTQRSALT